MLKQILNKIFGSRSLFKFALSLLLIFAVFFMANFYIHYIKTAETLGRNVGSAVGNIKGITTGMQHGVEDGKYVGIHADDYEVEVKSLMAQTSKLEVLVADAAVYTKFEIGKKYEAMYIYKGDAIFTVDLAKANAKKQGSNRIKIESPMPVVEFIISESETEKLFDSQKGIFIGDKSGGYEAYIEHRNTLNQHLEDELVGYDMLLESAKESAIRQLTSLAKSVCGREFEVEVEFKIGEEH